MQVTDGSAFSRRPISSRITHPGTWSLCEGKAKRKVIRWASSTCQCGFEPLVLQDRQGPGMGRAF
jgi:hypothetical protein